MDRHETAQLPGTRLVGSSAYMSKSFVPYQSNKNPESVVPVQSLQSTGISESVIPVQSLGSYTLESDVPVQSLQSTGLPVSTGFLAFQQQLQQQEEHKMQQQIQSFWANQNKESEQVNDFKNHSLPLLRIKKIIKSDEKVRMISAETPAIFARASEMFIQELTLRAWNNTKENKRKTIRKNDIMDAIGKNDMFDFLIDIVPTQPAPVMFMGVPVVVQGDVYQQPCSYMTPQMWLHHHQPLIEADSAYEATTPGSPAATGATGG